MSKTISQWEEIVSNKEQHTTADLQQYRDSIQNLRTFNAFWKEYSSTGLGVIEQILTDEIKRRLD